MNQQQRGTTGEDAAFQLYPKRPSATSVRKKESSSSMTSVSMDSCVFSEAVLYLKDDDSYRCMETTHHNKEVEVANESNFWMPLAAIVDQIMDKENLMSPTATMKMRAQQCPSRNVLPPVNTNISGSILEDTAHKPQANEVPCHSKAAAVTVPHVLNHDDDDETLREGTALHRFHALGSIIKNSLIKAYLEFLNTASREELMGLKGIRQKMADYILNLREQSQPIKTLYDFEKIGMSSKQVEGILKRAAMSHLDALLKSNPHKPEIDPSFHPSQIGVSRSM